MKDFRFFEFYQSMKYIECSDPQRFKTATKIITTFILFSVSAYLLFCTDYKLYPIIYAYSLIFILFHYQHKLIEKLFYDIINPLLLTLVIGKPKIYYKLDADMGYSQKKHLEDESFNKKSQTALYIVTQDYINENNKVFCKRYNKIFHLFYKRYTYIYNIKKNNFILSYFIPTIFIIGIYILCLFITANSLEYFYHTFPTSPKINFLLVAQFTLLIEMIILGSIWFTLVKEDSYYTSKINTEMEKNISETKSHTEAYFDGFKHTFLIDFLYNGKYFEEKKDYFKSSLNYEEEKKNMIGVLPALVATFVLVFSFNILKYHSDQILKTTEIKLDKDNNVNK